MLRENKPQQHDKRLTKEDKTFLKETLTKAEALDKGYSKRLAKFPNVKQEKKQAKEKNLADKFRLLASFADENRNKLDGILGKPTVSISISTKHHS